METHPETNTSISAVPNPECVQDDMWTQQHTMEYEVRRRLTQHPGVQVQDLVVRRIPQGVCLEGRVILHEPHLDLRALMQGINGLEEIRNHLLMTPDSETQASSCSSPQEHRREYTEQGKIAPFDFPHQKIPDVKPR